MTKNFKPKKSLGQNFLINPRVRERIINACRLSKNDTILEIGPGQGAITRLMAPQVGHVYAVEKDRRLVKNLNDEFARANVTIINADILKFSWSKLPKRVKVIGNLPYNISTPIIEKLIGTRARIQEFYIMVQKEYAQRLVSKPNSKTYGSISCFIQYFADLKSLFRISKGSFRPVPKVESAFLRGEFYTKPRFQARNEELLFKLIRTAFNQRRKTLENSLKTFAGKEALYRAETQTGINLKLRAEALTLEQFVVLSNQLNGGGGAV